MKIDPDALYSTGPAAKGLDLEASTLEAWRCRGGGPRFIKVGRLVKYRGRDLIAFLDERTCRNTIESTTSLINRRRQEGAA
jgi:hypothetical protein